MTWITAALSLLGRIPGMLGALKALFAGGLGAWVMHRRQQQAQELEDAQAKVTRAQAEADAARAGRDANLRWMRENRPRSVQPIRLDRDSGTGRGDRER